MEVPIIISGLSALVGATVYKGGATLSIKGLRYLLSMLLKLKERLKRKN